MDAEKNMNRIIRHATRATALILMLYTATAFGQDSGVIGIKFGFSGGYSSTTNLNPTDQAGVISVTNWNNLLPTAPAGADTTWSIPQDSAGNALSGVTLTAAGIDDGWMSGGTECANGRLLFNCWKFNGANGQVDGGGKNFATFTVANLPGSTYDVYVYINDNNGNYWGNVQANSVLAIGSNIDSDGFNGARTDPCSLGTPLHTAGGFGNPANYVRLPFVATTTGGVITVTVVMIGGGDFGVSGIELAPSADLVLLQDTLPNYAETVVGDQVVYSAAFSNSPAVNLQWQGVSASVTNNISTGVVNVTNGGLVTSTLTLNNVQLTNSGNYHLQAVKVSDSTDIAFSSDAPLVVNSPRAPVNNVIVNFAGQTGANFYPPWTVDTNIDLIYGFVNGAPQTSGQFVAGSGNFGLDLANPDPTILSDGVPGNSKLTMVTCGPSGGSGQSMTYTLFTNSAPSGYDLTNITVYGGWTDGGRNEQTYQVLYSTVASPATFVPLITADYLPADPSGAATATRTTLVPATGALAHNVYAIEFNFNTATFPKNGYEGYSEITVGGTPSLGVRPTLTQDVTPLTAEDVVGGTLTMSASFSGADTVQWTKNGVSISGATNQTLTLNNLQLSDTATAGGYALVASNAAGTTSTRPCAVIVDPVPAPVGTVLTTVAYQSSDLLPGFSPTWDTTPLAASLIFGQDPPGAGYDTVGDFTGGGDLAGGLPVLTDGNYGVFQNDGSHPAFAACGTNAGQFVSYLLPSDPNGYYVTNIQIAGGWNDNGRNTQEYTVSYSTVGAPSTFIPLTSISNSPSFGNPVAIRTTFTSTSGLLASNVYAINVDFTMPPGVPNGYSGYSEISVFGSLSAPAPSAPPIVSAPHVSGGNLIVTGTGGTPNRGYTWLTATNLTAPINWTTNSTGVLDGTGSFSNSIPINPGLPASFFKLRMP